ncbi:uncharacterized protein LOC123556893 isoform X2 [Mercenaria mercenaria]|uniref:uncharacterized protein LOC123556893 isoform X2 n=1 Tax=Mercenaria mercenaria TaxID=6596 RepID=UPI00234F7A70|nr:uncharacterized protein LOC123556893 isoform X2 [Mercenaria mercenaria]
MRLYKKLKFPFEVTKGRAEDLYRLRFMRKSELEPSVRHNLRHNVGQMGRQLDLWFKEQLFTIGSLNKEQEKINQSRKRLKTEIRRSKKREYARQQEEIRIKLKNIKMKMLMMKVIQKFKENVSIARSYRSGESRLKGNVDVLRVSGNKQLIHGSSEKQKTSHDIETVERDNQDYVTDEEHRKSNNDGDDRVTLSNGEKHQRKEAVGKSKDTLSRTHLHSKEVAETNDFCDIPAGSYDYDSNDNDVDDDDVLGQRYPSSRGSRMETIPEEAEEVEVEMEDLRNFPKLTKRRLHLLNRSQSKRNIFEVNDNVPLLPEVSGHHVQSNDMGRHLPDTADKETQTSDKPEFGKTKRKKPSHLRRAADNSERNGKKTIVVKLPRSKIPTPRERKNSAKSNSGHCGSDDSDEDYNDETTDTDFAYGFESDLVTSELTESDNDDDAVNEPSVGHKMPDFTLTKHKRESGQTSQSLPSVTNIEANFPNITTFSIQNSYSLRYKERSFVLNTFERERATGSAKLERKSRELYSEDNNQVHSPRQANNGLTKDMKKKRSEEIRKLLMADNCTNKQENPNIAIYGRKPEGVPAPHFPSPPNSPGPNLGYQGFSPRRSASLSHQKHLLYTQTRAKAEQQEKIHNIVSSEPVQKYERTRSGKIRPFGTPRIPNLEIASLREQYYRDKLLKAERDSILKQNMKMKKFIGTFDKDSLIEEQFARLDRGQGVILQNCRPFPVVRPLELKPAPQVALRTDQRNRLEISFLKFTNRSRTWSLNEK